MEYGQARRIIVAVEASEKGIYALEWALKYLTPPPPPPKSLTSDQFVILYVVSPSSPGLARIQGSIHGEEEMGNNHILWNLAAINQIKDTCRKHNVNYELKAVEGDAKLVICEAEKRLTADLLVVGNHAYCKIKRLFQQSSTVGDYCVRNAKCPVLVVKSQVMST